MLLDVLCSSGRHRALEANGLRNHGLQIRIISGWIMSLNQIRESFNRPKFPAPTTTHQLPQTHSVASQSKQFIEFLEISNRRHADFKKLGGTWIKRKRRNAWIWVEWC
ncbi:unnamed protein product [Caenorhabditis nigoni]